MECPGHLGRISLNSRFRIIPASFSFHKKNVVNSSDIERRSNKKQKRITYSEYEFLLAIKNLIIDENMQKIVVSFQFNCSLQAFPSNTLVGIYNMRRHNDFVDSDIIKKIYIPDVVFEISFTLLLPLSLNLSFENTILVQKEFYSVLLMAIIKLDCLTPYKVNSKSINKMLTNKITYGNLDAITFNYSKYTNRSIKLNYDNYL
ncbi:hypothetical protein U3516DRAFT_737999 [Neocallimastix sp. 'constans']